ncbi:hypothetical protein JCM3766R1_004744 [Sporobolomyces carnicolor]
MTSKDVRDIMQLGPAPTGGLSTGGKRSGGPPVPQLSRQPRPDGITRELYALIGDNNPSLAMLGQPALAKPKFKERNSSSAAKRAGPHGAGDDRGSKWRLIGFTNPCRDRSDAAKRLVLKHWVKDVPKGYEHGTPDTKFQKFNTTSQPFSYTDREYQEWLQSPEWTKEETDHLFGLAKEYDLRFIVMADRWEIAARPRSVDAMKDRYYSICRTLAEKRPDPPISSTPGLSPEEIAEQKEKLDKQRQDTVASFSFDLNRELERKAYLGSLLTRTRQQIAEEDFLYVESRRIEQNYHEIARERQELLKLLGSRQGVGTNPNQPVYSISPNGTMISTSANSKGGGAHASMVGGAGASGGGNKQKKMLGWEFVGDGNGLPEGWAGEGSKRKATAAQDAANCIERHPAPSVSAPKSNMWPSVALRSSRLQPVKSGVAQKVSIALGELGLSTLLIMPTRQNLEKLDQVQTQLSHMVEVKKAVDRIQQEIRTVKKKKELLLGGGGSNRGTPMLQDEGASPVIKLEDEDRQRNKRSASVASSTVSTKRARRE